MKVRELITHLEALQQPDAQIVFVPQDQPENAVNIRGGIMAPRAETPTLVLSPISLAKVGGF